MAQEGRGAFLRLAATDNAIHRDIPKFREAVCQQLLRQQGLSDAAWQLIRENSMLLLDFSPAEWAADLIYLLESMNEWTHRRIVRLISCRLAAEPVTSAADLAKAFIEGSVMRGQINNRMIYRFLEGLEVAYLEPIMDLALAKLAEADFDGCPQFPTDKDHTEAVVYGFRSCLLKCAQLLGTLEGISGAAENRLDFSYPEKLCLSLFDQLQWFVQQEKLLARMVASVAPTTDVNGGVDRTSVYPQITLEGLQAPFAAAAGTVLASYCARLQLRLDCLYTVFEVVCARPDTCRLADFIRLIFYLLGVS
jgi:hypothetical protein